MPSSPQCFCAVANPPAPEEPHASAVPTTEAGCAAVAKAANILIVENELLVAMGLRRMLESVGHRVCGIAATAAAAMDLARAHAPDLVLMDVTLRGQVDGIEAAAALLAERSFALVFVTAHSDLKTRARMQALHPVGILPKPFTERQLLQIIQTSIALPAA